MKSNDATTLRPNGDRIIDAPLVNINLTTFIVQLKQEETWKKSGQNAITLFKSMIMRIILIALHKNTEMKEHTTAGSISIQVIEGEMVFTTAEQTLTLGRGQMLVLHEGIPHSIFANTDTVFLLTLSIA